MIRLKLLCTNSNVHLFRQLEVRQINKQLFRTSCSNNKVPSACESSRTSSERNTEFFISSLAQSIREQSDRVRKLKEIGTSTGELNRAIHELLRRKQELVDWALEREAKENESKPDFKSNSDRVRKLKEIGTSKTELKSEASLAQSIREQSDRVRKLKEIGTSTGELNRAIHELLRRKQELVDWELERAAKENESKPDFKSNVFAIDRTKFDILVRRRFIYDQSFDIYGGVSGFYDFGPIGCAIKANLLQLWRKYFVLEDHMLEIDCPALTSELVFKASGHIDRFTDYLVKDVNTNECFRIDHLIKSHLQELAVKQPENRTLFNEHICKLDGASKQDLQNLIKMFNVKSPKTGNNLSDPMEFNLMFDTKIGPSNSVRGFLRPETSQGIFVNFKRLLEYNQGRLPFSVAQIGNAFRNEIAPKSGLLRNREFTLAEIAHFFDPNEKSHPKFQNLIDTKIVLYSANHQMNNQNAESMTIAEAVKNNLIANETFGYFLAKIQQFLLHVGISPNYLRFRQHMSNEMAHYAVDCWDAECLTSHGWIECVGCANRSAYDLQQHSKASGVNLTAERRLPTPIETNHTEFVATKDFLRKMTTKKANQVKKMLASLDEHQRETILNELNENGYINVSLEQESSVRLDKTSFEVKENVKVTHVEEITPNVIEPSFGIGRILYAILEHSFRKRDGDSNSYFALPISIAAHKCSILPLSNRSEFQPFVQKISSELIDENISHKIDDISGSIGRRYVRSDEIGIPFGITIDFDSLKVPNTVTLRERDSKEQLRIPLNDICKTIWNLSNHKITWQQLTDKYPKFEKQQSAHT